MDEVMEDAIKFGFLDQRIDPDYEFDAAQYFDFTRAESCVEAQEAERWFESAGSCPPARFIITWGWSTDIPVENANASQKSQEGENMNSIGNDSKTSMGPEVTESDGNNGGLNSHNHMAQDIAKSKRKTLIKSSPRSSTLMKPTASHLAKQKQRQEVYSSLLQRRSPKPFVKIEVKNSQNPSVTESEASKRQKLDSGYLCKVAHLKHQALFVHKVSKKVDMNSANIRPKVTISREPDLETAHRAQRHRPTNVAESSERTKLNARRFKARPLNRKILEAPSLPLPKKSTPQLPEFQVFHLKTSERAMQHTMNNEVNMPNSNLISQSGTVDYKRSNYANALKLEKCETVHKFKARTLNKKIFSSGELGIFPNIKWDNTIPMKLKFPTDKRCLGSPPIELFNKLSLTSDAQTNAVSESKQALPTEGSKENAPVSFDQEHEVINGVADKPQRFWGKQNQCGRDWMKPEIESQSKINRSLDIR